VLGRSGFVQNDKGKKATSLLAVLVCETNPNLVMLSAEPREQTRLAAEASRKGRAAYMQHQGVLPKIHPENFPKCSYHPGEQIFLYRCGDASRECGTNPADAGESERCCSHAASGWMPVQELF
jgi:hypothetical protein